MIELNNLAKYSSTQIEGMLKQHKRIRSKYWILVIIFSTLMSVTGALSIISACLYAFQYHENYAMRYVAIITCGLFVAFLILFFVFFGLHYQQTIVLRKINNFLKNQKK